MRPGKTLIPAAFAASLGLPAAAQVPSTVPAPQALPAPAGDLAPHALVLRAGTEVPMAMTAPLSSKRAHQGQRIDLEVTADVLVDGQLVIRRGMRGVGEVSRVVEKGVFGKSGKLRVRAMFIELGGSRIRLDGETGDRGTSGAAPVVAAVVMIGVSGSLISGTSAVLPAGSPIVGRVYQDVQLLVRAAPAK
jgi:hypothetical protein